MPLRLTLKPNERLILGGAVLRNGRSRAELFVENEVPVLRGSDILSPTNVRTPCERIMLALQLLYVEPQRRSAHLETYRMLVSDVLDAVPSCRRLLEPIEACVQEGRLYPAIKHARALLEHERTLISHVS